VVIRRFDVVRNPGKRDARTVPYLLVLQSELLDAIDTRVVAPLVRPLALASKKLTRVNPEFEIDGEVVIMLTQQIASVPIHVLSKRVANLGQEHTRIVAALDLLFSGI